MKSMNSNVKVIRRAVRTAIVRCGCLQTSVGCFSPAKVFPY